MSVHRIKNDFDDNIQQLMHDKLNAGGHKRGRYMSSETLIHIIFTSNTGSFEVDLSQCRSRKRTTELKMLKTDEHLRRNILR